MRRGLLRCFFVLVVLGLVGLGVAPEVRADPDVGWRPVSFDRSKPTVPQRTGLVTSADGTRIAVQEYGRARGTAPTVVLVHGYPNSHAVWYPILPYLAKQFRVITYDMRGVGGSGHPDDVSAYSLQRLDQDFEAVYRRYAMGERVHYFGHDFGGVIGWDLLTSPRNRAKIASFTTFGAPSFDMFGTWFRKHLTVEDQPFGVLDVAQQMARIPEFPGFVAQPAVAASWIPLPGNTSPFDLTVRWFNRMSDEPRESGYPNTDGYHAGLAYTANFQQHAMSPAYNKLPSGLPPIQSLDALYDRFFSNEFTNSMDFFGAQVVHRSYHAGHWGIATTDAREIAKLMISWVQDHS